jgi:carboxyl-terminal processing protease
MSVGMEAGGEASYHGKVIILVNELTQSHAEFTVMALQAAPHSIVIGSQTAGADGNVSWVFLP